MTEPAESRVPPAATLWIDLVDPVSFLMDRRVAAAESDTGGAGVLRAPREIRPPPAPLVDPDDPSWRGRWEAVRDAGLDEGLSLASPGIVPWTRKAWELVFHAREKEVDAAAVRDAVLRAYHLEGRDIGRVDVLVEIAVAHGLDLTDTRAVLDVDRWAAEVADARREAERLGVHGVPTLLAGGRALEGLHDAGAILAFLRGS